MCSLAPAIPLDVFEESLRQFKLSDRDIRDLLHDHVFSQLLYKNHQLCFFYEYTTKVLKIHFTYKTLGTIFQMTPKTVSKNIKKGPQDPKMPGRHMALSYIKEEIIIKEIIESGEKGKPMREKDILEFISKKFNLSLTSGWFNCFFIRRIEKLKKCHSSPQDDKRLSIPREFLKEYLLNVHKNVEGRYADLVLNIDEVGVGEWEDRKPFKVIIDRNFQGDSIEHSVSRTTPHTTMVACIAASGASCVPLIISKRPISENFWKSGVRKDEEVIIKHRDSPYINEALFLEYLNLVVIPYVKIVRMKLSKPQAEAVLMMDSCSSHCTHNVLQLLGKNNILALFYPSHTTNLFQALDLSLFGILKNENQFLGEEIDVSQLENMILKTLRNYQSCATSFNIRGSFKKAGLINNTSKKLSTFFFDTKSVIENPGFKKFGILILRSMKFQKDKGTIHLELLILNIYHITRTLLVQPLIKKK